MEEPSFLFTWIRMLRFLLFCRKPTNKSESKVGKNWIETKLIQTVKGAWTVQFDAKYGGPKDPIVFNSLSNWTENADSGIRYYSGTASYRKDINFHIAKANKRVWLNVGSINNVGRSIRQWNLLRSCMDISISS
jgi:hypothetical protein